MNETVSVDEAIRKGHRIVTYPSIAIMVGVAGVSVYAGTKHLLPGWSILMGVLVAFVGAWLYWSWKITKWRLWAFENVGDLRELKKRAVLENLIWEQGSWFEKTEIRSAAENRKWQKLKNRVQVKEVFQDDLSIPSESVIRFSKGKMLVEMALILIVVFLSIYFLYNNENGRFFWMLIIVLGIIRMFKRYRQSRNKNPQLILNEKGIETVAEGFTPWKNVFDEEVVGERSGKTSSYYLTYHNQRGIQKLMIDDLDTDYNRLMHLLKVYRGRYENTRKEIELQ